MARAERLVPVALAVVAAFVIQTLVLQLGNDLHTNGRWESRKVGLSHGILGSVAFLTTRTALFRDRVDLGVWHGYHEIVTRDAFAWSEVRVRIELESAGWVLVELGDPEQRMAGFRLSRSEGLPSACLVVDPEGAFLHRQDVAFEPGEGWHALRLVRRDDALVVHVDGREVARCADPGLPLPHRLGLRGSADDGVHADDVIVRGESGTLFRERFANRRHATAIFLAAFVGVWGVELAFAAVFRRLAADAPPAAVLRTAAGAVVLVIATLAWAVDWIVLWRLHPDDPDFHGYANRIEYEGEIVPRLAREVPPGPAQSGVRRIVFLGSSQTWGSGARRPERSWVRRTTARLDACAGAQRVEGINTGIPAFTAAQIRPLWEERWSAWQPDAVVIDLANNDRDPDVLGAELDAIARFNAARGIGTAIVLEPNTIENRKSLDELAARHDAMRTVARRHGLPVVDMHARLVARRDEGFLWWDRVHLTDFGHRVFAEELAPELARWLGFDCEPPEG